MGKFMLARKKHLLKKIENPTARQVTYSKRKDGMIKKANELAVLCGVDIALIMFSPSGRLTCYSSNRRVEDVFLRYLNRPDDLRGGSIASQELLIQNLRKVKYEAEMLEKIAYIEELEGKLEELNKRKQEANEKMRYYQPDLGKINSSLEADVHLRFLKAAIKRIQLARAKLLGKEVIPEGLENTEGAVPNSEVAAFTLVGESSTANHYAAPPQTRAMGTPPQELYVEENLPGGANLTLDYVRRTQNQGYMFGSQRHGPNSGNL